MLLLLRAIKKVIPAIKILIQYVRGISFNTHNGSGGAVPIDGNDIAVNTSKVIKEMIARKFIVTLVVML
jgi:hypothetical protein